MFSESSTEINIDQHRLKVELINSTVELIYFNQQKFNLSYEF